MKATPLLLVLAALVTFSAGALRADELYNGIELPAKWPPTEPAMVPPAPMDVPYLKHPPAVIKIDVGRQLFVDDFLIDSTTLKRNLHLATLYENNPVLKPDQPAELEGKAPMAMVFSDGVWFDPKDQLFKMWYMAGYGKQTAYATSRDGIRWDKPTLDVKPGSNIVQRDGRDSSTVWMDLEETDPQRRFKMWRIAQFEKHWSLILHFSPDGIHWTQPIAHSGPTGDRTTVFYNPFRKVWVYGLRDSIRGNPRIRRYWETKDILASSQWTKTSEAVLWTNADKLDPPREDLKDAPQLYNLDAAGYESVMLGLFTVWRGDRNIPPGRPKPNSVWLGFSRDGFHWDRPDRRPFIPVSEKQGDWNWGNVQSAGGCCLIDGDRLLFYFSGRAGVGPKMRDGNGATGLAILRRDGFASMDAGAEPAVLTTRPVKFSGKRLFVNVAAPSGELRVEVLDEAGKTIEPFTKENCQPIRADKTLAAVTWKDGADLSKLAGRPVRFRFQLSNGALYAFWVSPDDNGASHGYVAAGGPGFTSNQDTVGTGGMTSRNREK